jgi:hypothetical protein
MSTKRMGGLGKLSDFGKTAQPQSKSLSTTEEQSLDEPAELQSSSPAEPNQDSLPPSSDSTLDSPQPLNFRLASPDLPSSSFPPSPVSPSLPVPSASPPFTSFPSPPSNPQVGEKLVTVNIKILQKQQEWLTDTAKTIRGNNSAPVPPGERMFPQHLIGVAIDLLQSRKVDWSKVKNEQDLRKALKL